MDAKMYTEFGQKYPTMRKASIGYRHFFANEIIILLKDGTRGIYNRVLKEFRFPDKFEAELINHVMDHL